MAREGASIDRVVSALGWARMPQLMTGVERWAELAGPEGAGLVVSAVAIGMDWVSVRVSRPEAGRPDNWTEWLTPTTFAASDQAAIDHYAARQMQRAAGMVKGRGIGARPTLDFPDPPAPRGEPDDPRGVPMAKAKSKDPVPPPAPGPSPAKPGKAAAKSRAAVAGAKAPTPRPEGMPAVKDTPTPAAPPPKKSAKPAEAEARATRRRPADRAPVAETRSAAASKPATTRAAPKATAPAAEARSMPAKARKEGHRSTGKPRP